MDSPRLINPKGCQRVAGGRSPFAPNDHRKTTSRWPSTQKGCQNLGDRNPWQEGVSVLWGNANLEQAVTGLALLPECRTSRSEEHTSELQSLRHLVCRLLLE